jgi:predicted signal transduction protein with EAL and GGDEF domain
LPKRHHVLPHTALGWWALGLMVVTAVCPLWWAALTPVMKHVDPNARARMALMAGIAVPSCIVAARALRHGARSVALVVVSAIVAFEAAFVALAIWGFSHEQMPPS